MRLFYDLAIRFYELIIHISSLFNDKAKLWKRGRKYIFTSLKLVLKKCENVIWVHCASYGEFEQGKPLIEKLKEQHPEYKILLTFFSPSGYRHFHNYEKADFVFYLPLDSHYNARRFLDIVKPKYIFFIKYEYWFNYIHEAHKRRIPFYVVSAIFRDNQYFFKIYGHWFRVQLRKISYFFVQDDSSKYLLHKIGIQQCETYGDTRFDTVIETIRHVAPDETTRNFCKGKKILIAGSTWEPDEKILHELLRYTDYSLILTPHEVHASRLNNIKQMFSDYPLVSYSEAQAQERQDFNGMRVLLIDTIGILKMLYQYGEIAYIGGGFGRGIHNTLEAAAYGMPILFGPNYTHFKEACDLIGRKGAFCVHNSMELAQKFMELTKDENALEEAKRNTKAYVESKTGVTEKIMRTVFPKE